MVSFKGIPLVDIIRQAIYSYRKLKLDVLAYTIIGSFRKQDCPTLILGYTDIIIGLKIAVPLRERDTYFILMSTMYNYMIPFRQVLRKNKYTNRLDKTKLLIM